MPLISSGCVELRLVEQERIEALVRDRGPVEVVVEWGGGTGPFALRPICTCPESGICAHIVASLEAVRAHDEPSAAQSSDANVRLEWLPAVINAEAAVRPRAVWVVFAIGDGGALTASLALDSPRLRGVVREASAVVAMMETTPLDDWDERDRELLRDEAVREAFAPRAGGRALARAIFRLAGHPRLRFDDAPATARHPAELPAIRIDLRGLRLRAARSGAGFVPLLEDADDRRFVPRAAMLLDGPPPWLFRHEVLYLLDGTFDARGVIAAATLDANDAVDRVPPLASIVRAAPYLVPEDRAALGIVDAGDPAVAIGLSWRSGAIVANPQFVDRATGVRASFSALGTVVAHGDRFVRFSPALGGALRGRLLATGFVPRGSEGFALHGAARAARFVHETLPEWSDLDVRLDANLADFAAGANRIDVAVRARRNDGDEGWFDVDVDVYVDDRLQPLTPQEMAVLLGSAERYAEVGGRLCDLVALRERGELVAELLERRRSGLAALVALRDEMRAGLDRVDLPPEVEELRERVREFAGIERVTPPPIASGELRGYQERGLDFLAYLAHLGFGGVLADDMGLGKTLEVIAYLLWRKAREGPAPALVIAPTSVTHAWETEIARFAPSLRTMRLHSGNGRAARYDEIGETDVVVTSYALARLDADALAKLRFRTLILDEAQHAKNPSSQIARVLRGLRADHRLALTGTPIENSLRDLWSIFSFVEPGLLGSEASFRRRFENPIAQGDARAIGTLRSRLEPFVLRRTKEDVAPELPDRTEMTLECELSPLQRRLYRGVAEAARREIFALIDRDGLDGARIHALAAITRLRQICAHPGLIFDEHRDDPQASGKFALFGETVDEVLAGGHRVLVFSAFASMLKLMRRSLDERGIRYSLLDGSTKDKDRRRAVEEFSASDGPPIFLCSLKAGGVGLTLTAADYVILYDPWWNPAVERQAIDRTHRIGQHRNVTAYRLVTTGSVEEKIRTLAERKSALSESVIKVDGALAKTLTREDLESLLADPDD